MKLIQGTTIVECVGACNKPSAVTDSEILSGDRC